MAACGTRKYTYTDVGENALTRKDTTWTYKERDVVIHVETGTAVQNYD